MTVAEYIAKEFKARGVKYVFGIPGGPSIPYLEAFREQGLEFILTSNEAAAGIMADVTGRMTGIPGICHATFGPGATNLATGLGGAMLDRSPLIALTSEMPEKIKKRTVQMNIDHQALFEPITKATTSINAKNAGDVIADSFSLAQTEYPGPVHIGLPSDQALNIISDAGTVLKDKEKPERLHMDPEIVDLLKYARKPILVLGLTASRSGMREEIIDFLESCPMPVILTPMAKGLVHEEHRSYCGVLFHASSDKLNSVINEADLVIGLGYDPVEYNYEDWMPDIPLLHFNTVLTDMPAGMMVKQVSGNLEGLTEMIKPVIDRTLDWDFEEIAACRNEIKSVFDDSAVSFGPSKVLKIMQETLPVNSILCLDVGSHIHLFGQYWKTASPGQLLMTNGWSGMGFGIPAAMAAALNKPGVPVACVTGDGGFLMMCGEMVTARRLELGIVFIVLCDKELNLIKIKEQRKGLENIGVDLYEGSLIGEKTFLGVPVKTCDNDEALGGILSGIYPLEGPVIIEVNIDPSEYNNLIIT